MKTITDIHSSDVWGLHFAPTGDRIATVSSDRTSALFTYPEGRYIGRAFEPEDRIESAAFTRDGTGLIGGSEDGRLHMWSLTSSTTTAVSTIGHTGRISDIALSGDGHLLASLGRDQTVRLWTLFNPVPTTLDRRVATRAKGVAISGDGTFVAAGDETGVVYLWKGNDADPRTFVGHEHQVWALAFSPDGSMLASGDRSGEVRIWDVESSALKLVRLGNDGALWWLGFTPDNKRLLEAHDGGIDIFDMATGDRVGRFPQDNGQVTRAAISPDGMWLAATTTDGRVRLFDLTDNSVMRDLKVLDDMIWSVVFSPDGRSVAVGSSDEGVSVWDVATGERRASNLAGHSGGATDLAFLADGATLAVVDRQGSLHLWDVVGERRLSAPIVAHEGTSWRLAAAPRADVFVTSGDDGRVRTWDILNVARACELGAPAFDRERQREYFGEGRHFLACAGR